MIRSVALLSLIIVAPLSMAVDPAPPAWDWPVGTPAALMRPFIAPATEYSSGHRGVDLGAAAGDLYAPAAGIVHFAGIVVDRPVLSLRHPGGLISSYEPVETTLRTGDTVARGDPIGTVMAGHCSSTCLHFGVRRDGEYVSPMLYLGGIARSVLLPTRR